LFASVLLSVIERLRGDLAVNWQRLCKECAGVKSVKEVSKMLSSAWVDGLKGYL
jgi:hypothetical protein